MAKKQRKMYIALEELNYHWDVLEVLRFDEMCEEGKSLEAIAKDLKRDLLEIQLLLLDRYKKGKLKGQLYIKETFVD